MKKLNSIIKLKSQRGGATALVFFTLFVFLIIASGAFMTSSTLRKSQAKSDIQIQEIYGKDVKDVDSVYEELVEANKSELEKLKDTSEYVTETKTITDKYKNKVVIPQGFKVASDSGLDVTEGIVIEDNDIKEEIGNNRGNQYVWVPVGDIIKSDGTKTTITLGRYTFADGINDKASDGTTVLEKGTPILKQSAENYAQEVLINSYYKELSTYRQGVASNSLDGVNTTALNLKKFVDSVKANGGYYIARYEASYGKDEKANSKVSNTFTDADTAPATRTEGMLWNYITQIDAAKACHNMYEDSYTNATTDLINSYAWDTAIVYIQRFSDDIDYSWQDGQSIKSSLTNTGVNNDEKCKINDMSSNIMEWTTEYSTNTVSSYAYPCTRRGGSYIYSNFYANSRYGNDSTFSAKNATFRSILYIK